MTMILFEERYQLRKLEDVETPKTDQCHIFSSVAPALCLYGVVQLTHN